MKITKAYLKKLIKEELENLTANESMVYNSGRREMTSGEMAVMGVVVNVFRNAGMTDTDLLEELALEVAENVGKQYDIVQKPIYEETTND